eukprot:TRINITY_DN779_c0_g1_i2.p1 TRINITY_DN779_c0_g1~~TRINITY_DN779_c0_g1_i2.p1  ORF type:complete len:707 (+),score=110.89 TRINITY_DN779_c0_g1_i2:43-2121(+)
MTVEAPATPNTPPGLLRSTGKCSPAVLGVEPTTCTPPEGSVWDSDDTGSPSTEELLKGKVSWTGDQSARQSGSSASSTADDDSERQTKTLTPLIPCTAGGKKPMASCFEHCPQLQAFIRCGPHHRAEISPLEQDDIDQLQDIWRRYRDDLTWPRFEKKPIFSTEDFDAFHGIAQKVVDAMVEEYQVPMVLDQATISNTNHVGHPPHADNVQFDSVWWRGKRIRSEDEIVAAREGAFVLWRAEKTSYRSYSCSVALSDPEGYEGGEVQFFSKWGSKDPIARYKCEPGHGVAFCGCPRNIHAVTGVKEGFRLVLLVWTRPPEARVPDSQAHVCYFRPGTGRGVWLTTADIQRCQARKHREDEKWWMPKDTDDGSCQCEKCTTERKKMPWQDPESSTSTGTSSPRTSSASGTDAACEEESNQVHCPLPQAATLCGPHDRVQLPSVLTKNDVWALHSIWEQNQDDLSHPWYKKKPTFQRKEFDDFYRIAQKVVDAMSAKLKQPLVLDQAAVNCTNHHGHPPHADNVQFDSVWWNERQIRSADEVRAAQGGAQVHWKLAKTAYRNYSATVALTDPWQYGGGELEFFNSWGAKHPTEKMRLNTGDGVAFCGCQRNIHAVTGVKWGFRLVLLVWTRPPHSTVPEDQKHVCYFRQGSGLSIWLTSADIEHYPARRRRQKTWVPIVNDTEEDDEEKESSAA